MSASAVAAIAAVIAFAIALILDLAGVAKGHVNFTTFALAGLLCLALALVAPGGWLWRGRPAA
jgi:hypothetical protein